MTAMQRRVMARPPLPRADVEDRAQVRAKSLSFRANLEAAVLARTHSQSCGVCGSVQVWTGSLDEWLSKSAAWVDVHDCVAVA